MTRIYHTWDKWECFPAGFYEPQPPDGITAVNATVMYRDFLRDLQRFERYLFVVIRDWVNSCEHNLSNESMNRVAWLGQASMCVATKIPRAFRSGFMLLTEAERDAANEMALKWLNIWLKTHDRKELSMDQAQSRTEANLY